MSGQAERIVVESMRQDPFCVTAHNLRFQYYSQEATGAVRVCETCKLRLSLIKNLRQAEGRQLHLGRPVECSIGT